MHPNDLAPVARCYDYVRALSISWAPSENDSPREREALSIMRGQASSLMKALRRYHNFETENFDIPRSRPYSALMKKMLDVQETHDNAKHFLLIYYGGHGDVDASRQAVWKCFDTEQSPRVNWTALQQTFATEDSNLDVLMIIDCCRAGGSVMSPLKSLQTGNVVQVLAACGFDSVTPLGGETTYTANLIKQLTDDAYIAQHPNPSVTNLHSTILHRLHLSSHKVSSVSFILVESPSCRELRLVRQPSLVLWSSLVSASKSICEAPHVSTRREKGGLCDDLNPRSDQDSLVLDDKHDEGAIRGHDTPGTQREALQARMHTPELEVRRNTVGSRTASNLSDERRFQDSYPDLCLAEQLQAIEVSSKFGHFDPDANSDWYDQLYTESYLKYQSGWRGLLWIIMDLCRSGFLPYSWWIAFYPLAIILGFLPPDSKETLFRRAFKHNMRLIESAPHGAVPTACLHQLVAASNVQVLGSKGVETEPGLTTVALHLAIVVMEDPEIAIKASLQPMEPFRLRTINKNIKPFLSSQFTDMLILRAGDSVTPQKEDVPNLISYIDQTASQVLSEPPSVQEIASHVPSDFDPNLVLLGSTLLQLKLLSHNERSAMDARDLQWWGLVEQGMHYASQVSEGHTERLVTYLDELDLTVTSRLMMCGLSYTGYHWSGILPLSRPRHMSWHDNFLSYTVQHAIVPYVKEKLRERPIRAIGKIGRPLIDYALLTAATKALTGQNEHYDRLMDVIQVLLDTGADPDACFQGSSALKRFEDALNSCGTKTCCEEVAKHTGNVHDRVSAQVLAMISSTTAPKNACSDTQKIEPLSTTVHSTS